MKKLLLLFVSLLLVATTLGEQNMLQSNKPSTSIFDSTKYNHPFVQYHETIWYKNWMTCVICGTWVDTFETIAKESQYVKALQGFMWLSCSTQFPQNFCKFQVENFVT